MGCDIHIVLEAREAGSAEWVGQWASDEMPGGRPKVAQRNYSFFAMYGVGRCSPDGRSTIYPRNIPKDVSRLAWLRYMRCPTDYHSASHADPQEFVERWVAANPHDDSVRPAFALWDLLAVDSDFDGDFRVVFWFDN